MDTNKIILLGNLRPANNDKIHQRNWIHSINGIVGCLTSTMYKDPPRILVKNNDR